MVPATESLDVPALATRRVLVVDDDREFATNLALVLRTRGYRTSIAFDAATAVTQVATDPPDVAILDIRLGPTSGVDLIPQLRTKVPDLICVMATAYAETDTAIQALRFGADDYLRKPFDPDQLLGVLDICFAKLAARRSEALSAHKARVSNERVVAFVTDEVRDPLAQLGSSLQQVDREAGDRMAPSTLVLMRTAYRRLEKLVQRVTGFLTHPEEAQVRTPSRDKVADVIRDASADAAGAIANSGSRLTVDCPGDVALVSVEGRVARRVLTSVLVTAAVQTRQGRITVFVAATEAGSIPKVTFRVRDSGSGIDASRVVGTMSFSGATTREEDSPEAALAAAGAECRAAGGSFVVQSSAGEGTTVSFALPQREVLELVPEA